MRTKQGVSETASKYTILLNHLNYSISQKWDKLNLMQTKKLLIHELEKTVQHNCHIADANHAGDYTLCIYLLKMRELYRWENKKTFSTNLANKTVAAWLRQREELWEKLESSDYQNIELKNINHSPFESDFINENLLQHQLVYSGGMGINNRPHFFLAELEFSEQHKDYSLYVAGKEYARDMSAPPAMSHNNTIYIRKESFRRLLWEKLETWRWNKPDNALGRAFACYDCESNLDIALNKMCDCEIKNVIQHEHGEIKAGVLLGPLWEELLFSLPHSKTSIMLRAIRDHLADSLTTLPALLKLNHPASWHFYFGNMDNMRKSLFPALCTAYDNWVETNSLQELSTTIDKSHNHWLELCFNVLTIYNAADNNSLNKIQELIEKNQL